MERNINLEKQTGFVSIALACLFFIMPVFMFAFAFTGLSPGFARTSFFGNALTIRAISPGNNATLVLVLFSLLLLIIGILFLLLGINQLRKVIFAPSPPPTFTARSLQGATALFLIFVFFAHLSSFFVLIWAGLAFAILIWQAVCWEENRRFLIALLGSAPMNEEAKVFNDLALPQFSETTNQDNHSLALADFSFDAANHSNQDEITMKKELLQKSTEEKTLNKKKKINIHSALLSKKDRSKASIAPIPTSIDEVQTDYQDNTVYYSEVEDIVFHEDEQLSGNLAVSGETFKKAETDENQARKENSLGTKIIELLGGNEKDPESVKAKLKEMFDKNLIDSETFISALEALEE